MTHKIATVTETSCYDKIDSYYALILDCAQPHAPIIHLDSPQWFAWLEAPENDGFSYALHNHAKGYIDGFMTVRRERRQRGGLYWSAYRRQGRRLRKIYLGLRHPSPLPGCVRSPHASTSPKRRSDSADVWQHAPPQTANCNSAIKEEKPVVAESKPCCAA